MTKQSNPSSILKKIFDNLFLSKNCRIYNENETGYIRTLGEIKRSQIHILIFIYLMQSLVGILGRHYFYETSFLEFSHYWTSKIYGDRKMVEKGINVFLCINNLIEWGQILAWYYKEQKYLLDKFEKVNYNVTREILNQNLINIIYDISNQQERKLKLHSSS